MTRLVSLLALLLILTACGSTGSQSPGAAATGTSGPTPTRAAAELLTPQPGSEPVRFPQDEAPHDKLTEWWYYTGHMFTESGDRYGFQLVFFQSQRAEFPS